MDGLLVGWMDGWMCGLFCVPFGFIWAPPPDAQQGWINGWIDGWIISFCALI